MSTEQNTDFFDERIDSYLRGKMTEEQAEAFEIEYLSDPALADQVHLVEQLICGLQLNQEQAVAADSLNDASSDQAHQVSATPSPVKTQRPTTVLNRLSDWVSEWLTPQTGWGAVAATVFLVPLMTIVQTDNSSTAALAGSPQSAYVHMVGQQVRSASVSPAVDTVLIDDSVNTLVIGFSTPPIYGQLQPISLTVYDDNNQVFWQGHDLSPDYRMSVYMSIDNQQLKPGTYHYELMAGDQLLKEGDFLARAAIQND